MKIERTKNTVRNIIFGFGLKIINIVLPFVSRTAILYILGSKYLGLSSLFSSILSFLSLAELGMGSAMVFSMYKPISNEDTDTICALLNLYKKFYRIIGFVIFGIGLFITPFLHIIINDDVPSDVNIYILYFIYLVNAVLSYWLFAYKSAIIQAYQRNDIESKIGTIITPLSYIFMLGTLFLTKNYYGYIIWLPIFTIMTNLFRMVYVNRKFPNIKPKGNIGKELKSSIIKKMKALIGTKLNTVVLHAADNIVMSAFLGLTVIAIYGNYYYIMSSIMGFLGICYSSMTAGIGNSLQTESLKKNYKDFEKFSFMNSWMTGWCTVCLVCLYQPFMKIWTGENLMFSFTVVLQLALYFYIYQIRKIPITYKDAGGIWWEDRYRPYVCMIVNLIFNIILVQFIGISGIILSTVFSLIVSIPWENYTIFKYIFKCSSKNYYLKMLMYFVSMQFGGVVSYLICEYIVGYGIVQLFIRLVVCIIVPNLIFILANFKREEFVETIHFLKRIVKR